MARIARPTYRVSLVDQEDAANSVEHEITVTYGDQLRGELEAGKNGLPSIKDAPQNQVSVWIWCALVRLGLYKASYQQFRNQDVVDVQPLTDDQGNPVEPVDVDPTAPVPSGPA